MEEDNSIIYSIVERNNIKVEGVFGLENNLDFRKINQVFYKMKYSIYLLSNDNRYTREKINELLEIEVKYLT